MAQLMPALCVRCGARLPEPSVSASAVSRGTCALCHAMGEEPSVAAGNGAPLVSTGAVPPAPLSPTSKPPAPAPPAASAKGRGVLVAGLVAAPFVALGVASAWVDSRPAPSATASIDSTSLDGLHDLASLRTAMLHSVGPEGLILGITIAKGEATFDVASDATRTRFDTVTVRNGGVASRKPMAAPPTSTPADHRLLPLSQIDLAVLPACVAAAREQTAVLGGRVTGVALESADTTATAAPSTSLRHPHWTVTIRDDRLRSGVVRCDLQGRVLQEGRVR